MDKITPFELSLNQSKNCGSCCRPSYGVPQDDGIGCCGAGTEGQHDEGALLNQLCSVLKDYEGLEEIDKMLGIPTLAGQVSFCQPSQVILNDCRSFIDTFNFCIVSLIKENMVKHIVSPPTGSSLGPGSVPGLLRAARESEASPL